MKPISPRYPTYVVYEGYDRALALQSVGEGWASLIHEVFDYMEQIHTPTKVVQVKEKWGGLRIYTDVIDYRLDEKIREAEKKSFTICEISGEPGKLRNCNGWYRTLSDTHGKEFPVIEE